MRKILRTLLLAVALLGGGVAVGVLILDRVTTTAEDQSFRAAFREVEVGMPERRVIELLGEPGERSPRFFLGQEIGFEDAYRRAERSGSARYLVWRRELDLVYTVGINASGQVTIAEVGGT